MFKAGTYYVGDLCYVIRDEWHELLERTDYLSNGEHPYKTGKLWSHGTAYGDGSFTDQFGNEYSVDAGLIGILPVELMDEQSDGGNIITFENDFECDYDDGIFSIGHLIIDTEGHEDDDDGEEEDEFCGCCGCDPCRCYDDDGIWDDDEEEEDEDEG